MIEGRETRPTTATDLDAPLWTWLVNVDPFVRRLGAGLVAAGVAVMALAPLLGLPLVVAGPAVVRWSKPEAIARWQERRALQVAVAQLDQRRSEGQLTDEAYGTRRAWLATSTAW